MQGEEVPRIGYRVKNVETVQDAGEEASPDDVVVVVNKTKRASEREAERRMASAIRKGEKSAETDERRRERKRERDSESPNTRERRLNEQREKEAPSKRAQGGGVGWRRRGRRETCKDHRVGATQTRTRPVPGHVHERHTCTTPRCGTCTWKRALLRTSASAPSTPRGAAPRLTQPCPERCASSRRLVRRPEIIQGPPGTGKTSRLVECLPRHWPGSLRAPTNVGAANLYERCVQLGHGEECALLLAPDRIPPGTAVQSNDPTRRIVCARPYPHEVVPC